MIVFGDKAYAGKSPEEKMHGYGIAWGVLHKAARGKKLTDFQEYANRLLSSVRSKVEHPFKVIKCQWKYTKVKTSHYLIPRDQCAFFPGRHQKQPERRVNVGD